MKTTKIATIVSGQGGCIHRGKVEPELIDFAGDTCYYSDGYGSLYVLDFEI